MQEDYHILVVEDNLGDYVLVEEFIMEQVQQAMVDHAHSFKEAKQYLLASSCQYNVVLLDLSLPDNSGETLILDMIYLCKNIPVVVLTGHSDFSFGVKSLSMGISDYLVKDGLSANALYKSIVYSTERKKISAALEQSEKRVRNFAHQLNNALEDEKSKIAREIHDEFGQQLTGLKMSLSALKKQKEIESGLQNLIDDLVSDVNRSIEMVRRIANELRPVLIDKLGLWVAVEWLVKEFEKKTGIRTILAVGNEQPTLSKATEINIFRICQEALTNIAKHAQATTVNIQLNYKNRCLTLFIDDDGIGLPVDFSERVLSMGIVNMKERSSLIGASLIIRNGITRGTFIELKLQTDD
ncbi:MAG: response regulator [Pedobacter sp.]|nr:MAG: response regulator [Pedobacter sp.]